MGSPSGSGVNTPSSRDCAYRRGPIPNASCRTGGGHGVRVRFCLEGSEVGSGISTARGADSSPGTARCKLVWCTEPYKGTILYVEFSSSHTRAGLDSIDFRTISVAEAVLRGAASGITDSLGSCVWAPASAPQQPKIRAPMTHDTAMLGL